jgi:hypothetical protein
MSDLFTVRVTIRDNRIPELIKRLPEEVDQVVQKTALDILGDARQSMSGEKHGRTYSVKAIFAKASGKKGKAMISSGSRSRNGKVVTGYKTRRASAPGEAPAMDTGHLANSIQKIKTQMGGAIVAVGADYGVPLEIGSRKMAARPFMKPAAERAWTGFLAALIQMWDRL